MMFRALRRIRIFAMMKHALTAGLILAASSYGSTPVLDTNFFFSNAILSRPTKSSVLVSAVPKKNLQIYVEYGTQPGIYSRQSETKPVAANTSGRFVIGGLAHSTRYYYRVRYKEGSAGQYLAGEQATFTTQRKRGGPFKFGIISDSHLYDKKGIPVMMRTTMQNLSDDSTDFILDLGDTFGNDHEPATITQQEMMDLHRNFLPYIGMASHSSHFFFCLGNHEGENGYYLLQTPPNNISVYAGIARKYYYANPVPDSFYSGNTSPEPFGIGLPENYYAWEWGDALFVVLDVYRYATVNEKPVDWDWTIGKTQYDWFKQTLENSGAKYKFVFAHHVRGEGRGAKIMAKYFEWGGYEKNGTTWGFTAKRPGWAMPIHQLMVSNGVNIFFQGHDHLFAQEELDGIVYQEMPMPSDSTYMIGMLANADAYTSNQLKGTGHLRVSVSPEMAKVEYVRSYLARDTNAAQRNGEIAFSYTVVPRPSAAEKEPRLPSSARLEQNYPNPFNPSTVIQYSLAEAADVTLKVFDCMGNEVAALVDGYQLPGEYAARFSPQPLSAMASGIYVYQLKAGSVLRTGKAVFLK